MANTSNAKTLSEKVWDRHVVHAAPGEPDLLYIDLHLVHEVTSPQAFDGLRVAGRPVRRPDLTVATEDHNVPTADIDQQWLNRTYRPSLTDFRLGWESYGVGLDTLWYDDVAVAGTRIGC